jgi:hypothetical protein
MSVRNFRFSSLLALALVTQFVAAGCSSGSSESSSAPKPVSSDTGQNSDSGQYANIEALQRDFIAAGGNCENGVSADFLHAKAGIDCGDGYTNLLLFEDRATAVEWGQASSALCNNMVDCEGGTLVGTNWAIVTQAPELFKEALSGTIIE